MRSTSVDSDPQSADYCFLMLPHVAESAKIGRFPCRRLPTVSACCVLSGVSSGVSSGVNAYGYRDGESLYTLPICCDRVPALAAIVNPLLSHRDSVLRDVIHELLRTPLPRTRRVDRG